MALAQYPRCLVVATVFFDEFLGDVRAAAFRIETPLSVQWTRNAARKADEFRVELNYRDLPIDPRIVSAIHVLILLGEDGADLETQSALRFTGYVDLPEISLDRGAARLVLDGRDYTRLALDTPWRQVANEAPVVGASGKATKKSRIRIKSGQTLGEFVKSWWTRMEVDIPSAETRPEILFEPQPAGSTQLEDLRVDRPAAGSILAMENGETAWDVLTKVCEWFGLVPMWTLDPILGAVLLIRSAASASNHVIEMAWGRNLSELKLSKNLQAPDRKQVRVAAYNPRLGRVFVADFPATPVPKSAPGTGGKLRDTSSDAYQERYLKTKLEKQQAQLRDQALQVQAGNAAPRSLATIGASVSYTADQLQEVQARIAAKTAADVAAAERSKEYARKYQFFREADRPVGVLSPAVDAIEFEFGSEDFQRAAAGIPTSAPTSASPGPPPVPQLDLKRVQYNLYGDYDQKTVNETARRIYEDQGRQRIAGTVKTKDLAALNGADIARVGNGDRLVLRIDPLTLHGVDHLTPGAAEDYLGDQNRPNALPPDAARFAAEQLAIMRNNFVEFYITEAQHSWDHKTGYEASITFSDFIVDRGTQ